MSTEAMMRNEAVQSEAEALLAMDEAQLEQLLTVRVAAIQQDTSLSLSPTFEVQESAWDSLPPWAQKTVTSMVNTALRQTHRVACSTDKEYEDLRRSLISSLGLGGTAAVLALAAFLTGTLGLAAALATVVATIVIKKIGLPSLVAGHKTLCEELGKILPPEA